MFTYLSKNYIMWHANEFLINASRVAHGHYECVDNRLKWCVEYLFFSVMTRRWRRWRWRWLMWGRRWWRRRGIAADACWSRRMRLISFEDEIKSFDCWIKKENFFKFIIRFLKIEIKFCYFVKKRIKTRPKWERTLKCLV